MKQFILIIIAILSVGNSIFGQTKYEKEFRINGDQVPFTACCFVKNLPFDKKIKWYKEVNLDRTSIEAKTKFQGDRYSIEFDKTGVFEDVEVTIKWGSVPTKVQQEITTYLEEQFLKYKIEKIQIQYTGNQATIKQLLSNETPQKMPPVHYEMILNTKTKQSYQKIEFLFSEQGQYVQSAVIISKNTDHLEY